MADVIIYPSGSGDVTGVSVYGATYAWEAVDDPPASPNDNDSIYTTSGGANTLFTYSAPSIPTGARINFLRVYFRICGDGTNAGTAAPSLKVGGTSYPCIGYVQGSPAAAYQTVYSDIFLNPATGVEWSAEDVNGTSANPLQQFGIYLAGVDVGYWDTTDPKNPVWVTVWSTLFCSQCFLQVIYDTTDQGGPAYRLPTGNSAITGSWDTLPTPGALAWTQVNDPIGGWSFQTDGNMLHTGTNGAASHYFTFPAFAIPASATINGVAVYCLAKVAVASGTRQLYAAIYANNVDYGVYIGDATATWAVYAYGWAANPSTGAAWTVEDVNGTGAHPLQAFGFGKYGDNPHTYFTRCYLVCEYSMPEGGPVAYAISGPGWINTPSSWGS